MLYDYIITLRRPSTKMVDLVTQIMYLLPFAVFLSFAFSFSTPNNKYLYLAVAILISWVWLFVKKQRDGHVYYTAGLAIAALGWFMEPYRNTWLGLLYIIAALAEREFKFPKEIGFSKEGLVLNSLYKKRYAWSQVNNAMIREGIITVDLKNNKVIQKEVDEEVSADTELEFNAFCKERLSAVATTASPTEIL